MKKISTDEVKRRKAEKGVVLIEALPERYFADRHLPGAINVPLDSTDEMIRARVGSGETTLITYCTGRTCPNSARLAARLESLGYKDVWVFEGGKEAWEASGEKFETNHKGTIMKALRSIQKTSPDLTLTILRVGLAIMIIPHGLQKTIGAFGGYGFSGTMGFFTDTMGIPWIFGFLAIVAESLGGFALLLGLFTRISALGVGTVMLVAALTSHLKFGFFMNWFGTQKGEGIEFFLLAISIAVALVISGGGALSVDRKMSKSDGAK